MVIIDEPESTILGEFHMTTTLSHPFMPKHENPDPVASGWKSLLLEPFMVVCTCLFWLAVLPVTGIFCAGVALYDKVATLRKVDFRLPDLRSRGAHNPLVLRKKSAPTQTATGQANSGARAFQS